MVIRSSCLHSGNFYSCKNCIFILNQSPDSFSVENHIVHTIAVVMSNITFGQHEKKNHDQLTVDEESHLHFIIINMYFLELSWDPITHFEQSHVTGKNIFESIISHGNIRWNLFLTSVSADGLVLFCASTSTDTHVGEDRGSLHPLPPGFNPPYPRPIFPSISLPSFFPYFFFWVPPPKIQIFAPAHLPPPPFFVFEWNYLLVKPC